MDLSILVINWNTRDLLEECLKSIYLNVRKVSFEILVVDNGSSDGSREMIKEEFSQVRLIENKNNLGFARANNQALKRSKGKYELLLNPDTLVRESALEAMVSFMEANARVGICGCRLLNEDGSVQPSCGKFPDLFTIFLHMTKLNYLYPNNRFSRRFMGASLEGNEAGGVDWVTGACLLVRRQAVEEIGLLDEGFFMYCEDMDWCRRMKDAGWKVYYLPQAEVVHYRSRSYEEGSLRVFLEGYRSWFIYLRKHFPRAKIGTLKLLVLAVELVKSVFRPGKFERFPSLLREIKSY